MLAATCGRVRLLPCRLPPPAALPPAPLHRTWRGSPTRRKRRCSCSGWRASIKTQARRRRRARSKALWPGCLPESLCRHVLCFLTSFTRHMKTDLQTTESVHSWGWRHRARRQAQRNRPTADAQLKHPGLRSRLVIVPGLFLRSFPAATIAPTACRLAKSLQALEMALAVRRQAAELADSLLSAGIRSLSSRAGRPRPAARPPPPSAAAAAAAGTSEEQQQAASDQLVSQDEWTEVAHPGTG